MRVKALLELIGCEVDLTHFSMLHEEESYESYDLIAIAHGTPLDIAQLLIAQVSKDNFLLLAPKADNNEQLAAFSALNKLIPNAVVIYPFFVNKEISSLLESILELGSDFILQLPTVLLVDHVPERLEKLEKSLLGAHIPTLSATSFNEALEQANKQQFDLLLCDFSLPDGSGLEVFAKIKRSQPQCRCLLFTSKPNQVSMIEAIRQGVEDVLVKPLDENVLLQSLHKLWQTELLKRHNTELVERLQDTVDALIEKDSLLRVIYKHTPDAIMLFERSGKIIEANDACSRLFSLAPKDFQGRSVFELLDGPSITQIKEKITTLNQNRQFSCDLYLPQKDGSGIPLVGSFNEIDHHGEIALAVIFKNVTHLKQKEELLLEAKDMLEEQVRARTCQLEQAKDLAEAANHSKSEFLANMSHELRTPMHSILSFARFGLDKLSKGDFSTDKLLKYLTRIESSGERLLSLLNNLLDLSKLDVGKFPFNPQAHNLSNIIKTAIEDVAGTAMEKEIEIIYMPPKSPMITYCDEEQINQLLRNILGNALKFSCPLSRITLTLVSADEYVIIEVIDSGMGIPEDELEHVFSKFVQSSKTNNGSGGTGLGLALCREFVLLHKGEITAHNNDLGGTTIKVRLPIKTAVN
ncbi:ATP-binding protein [Pseudoalteromonas shioyasakiensis]|uniref:sensor histidine kinase n=1 Tax=Pseudoalteromonas shioyasakiensis TaxID=1190813 RepID=UPI0021196F89|nr:ATP-binding protein [Pseudoalteromonas shioyasakiensis]MCQ8878925.1 ATP-binding protein [Pseudoalteromonas shioyasakiensis]